MSHGSGPNWFYDPFHGLDQPLTDGKLGRAFDEMRCLLIVLLIASTVTGTSCLLLI